MGMNKLLVYSLLSASLFTAIGCSKKDTNNTEVKTKEQVLEERQTTTKDSELDELRATLASTGKADSKYELTLSTMTEAGADEKTVQNGEKNRSSSSKCTFEKGAAGYDLTISYKGNKNKSDDSLVEELTIRVPVSGLSKQVNGPVKLNYVLYKDHNFSNENVIDIQEVKEPSKVSTEIFRISGGQVSVFAYLDVEGKNVWKSDTIRASGMIRCQAKLRPDAVLALNEDPTSLENDLRDEVSADRTAYLKVQAAKSAEQRAEEKRLFDLAWNKRKADAAKLYLSIVRPTEGYQYITNGGFSRDAIADAQRAGNTIATTASAFSEDYRSGRIGRDLVDESVTDALSHGIENTVAAGNEVKRRFGIVQDVAVAGTVATMEATDAAHAVATDKMATLFEVTNKAADAAKALPGKAQEWLVNTWEARDDRINPAFQQVAQLTYSVPTSNYKMEVDESEHYSKKSGVACRVQKEDGKDIMILTVNDFSMTTSFYLTASFEVDSEKKPVSSIKIISLIVQKGAFEMKPESTRNPTLLTPELKLPLLMSKANITGATGIEITNFTYSIFADFKNSKGEQVVVKGHIQCVE